MIPPYCYAVLQVADVLSARRGYAATLLWRAANGARGGGTGSVEYAQQVQAASGGVQAAAEDLQEWMSHIGSRLATVETSLEWTSRVAAATARDVKERLERTERNNVGPGGD